jgi:hypothetical protein
MFLMSAVMAIGGLLFVRFRQTDYERQTANMIDPILRPALVTVRLWHLRLRIFGGVLLLVGVGMLVMSFSLLMAGK